MFQISGSILWSFNYPNQNDLDSLNMPYTKCLGAYPATNILCLATYNNSPVLCILIHSLMLRNQDSGLQPIPLISFLVRIIVWFHFFDLLACAQGNKSFLNYFKDFSFHNHSSEDIIVANSVHSRYAHQSSQWSHFTGVELTDWRFRHSAFFHVIE